ncbi:MAG TPA: hypothetical protein VGP66_00535 [Candidatus Acidoferrum sp.]|jgi:hypothetical protein|nr:hypothetical protein [Candidatus Acidoferrum sp.]
MKRKSQELLTGLAARISPQLPAAWMLLVLLIFLAIRVLGSHSFESLHLFRKVL